MRRPRDASQYLSQEAYHQEIRRPYKGALGWAVNKKDAQMARVLYVAPHENRHEEGVKRGRGNDYAKWILSEEWGTAEGLLSTKLELMIDAELEAGACIGLHRHTETEEVYYVLEGEITMTTVAPDGREHRETLAAGDAHLVKLGQSHYGEAGPEGARFIAVAVRQ